MRLHATRAFHVLAGALVLTALAACGSGGGISGTRLVAGPIAEFGSIVVNGIELDTTGAVVTIEGDPAEVADLRLGMFVFVRATVPPSSTTGRAQRIASDHVLEGPVDGVNVAAGTFSALSQLVITNAATVFDQTTLATLLPGDVVEVFGVRDADASIRATRVERKQGVTEFEVTGTISSFDAGAQTFDIGILTVDFSSALVENAPPGGLADGLLVEVETDEVPVGDLMLATNIEVLDPASMFEDDDEADIQGFVTEIVSSTVFVLNGVQRVQITDQTRFEGGTAGDLVLNAQVDVSGTFDTQSVLVAAEIEFVSIGTGP